jgi:hypothetical protein
MSHAVKGATVFDPARALLIVLLVLASAGGSPAPLAAAHEALPAPPAPDLSVETLFETAFPADAVPARDPRIFFVRLRYARGAVFDRPAVAAAEYVVAGSLVVRSAGRVVVQRDSASLDPAAEEIAPGRETTLGPGDVAVFLTPGAAQTVRNPGTAPATTLKVLVTAGREAGNALPHGFATYILGHLSATDWQRSPLPVGAVRVRVERVTFAPGASAPVPSLSLPVLRYVAAGELQWAVETPATWLAASPPIAIFRRGQSLPWQPQPPGSRLLLHSSGDEPLELLVLSMTPA